MPARRNQRRPPRRLLHSLSKDTQFLLVTHSKRMMQSADMIYGVTMQEPGVSKVVSVRKKIAPEGTLRFGGACISQDKDGDQ
jgi:hypothetical protein